MNSEKTTQEQLEKGFEECECGHGVELLQAGFEIELHSCATCCRMVADRDEFFNVKIDANKRKDADR